VLQQFHFTYKVTHLPSKRFYLGKHTTLKIRSLEDDTYLGSGTIWKNILGAHPLEEFERTILQHFDSKDETRDAEKAMITEEIIADPLCMNLIKGGTGGDARNFSRSTSPHYIAQKGADTLKANPEKLKARNEKIGIRQKAFAGANPEIVKARIAKMNKTCKGTTKENNPNIQKQIDERRKNHSTKMELVMDQMSSMDLDNLYPTKLSQLLNVSICTAGRMKDKLRKGQRTWFPL
jgi:hypothetical protein